ncbi:hypothetical protein ACCS91_05355 [Rhizobium ruizarguesonis]|uniref:hypothetical protein n=1 Tax=Rhizobium ruizarguesonis TaxID=2081791 RepID=UPI0013D3ED29|nr:hypothetical protein [Rhizobium ruizarguesonis]QIJ44138.1 hypothetical protein G7039_30965 [Rhizobium leguminosarum]
MANSDGEPSRDAIANAESPLSFEEADRLECAAVWSPEHVEDRLRDHLNGISNKVGINAAPKIAMIYLSERPVLARSADRLMAAVFETAKHRGQGASEIALTLNGQRDPFR